MLTKGYIGFVAQVVSEIRPEHWWKVSCLGVLDVFPEELPRLTPEWELNKVTMKNRYFMPKIDNLFDQLKGTVCSSR